MSFIKQGIRSITDTRKYAREKNVPNWFVSLIGGILIAFIASTVLTLYSIIFMVTANPNRIFLDIFGNIVIAFPFILTFFFMITIGKYPIKAMIYFSYLIQKGIMKLVNKLDMYLWKKTGKDSIASNFIVKHKRIVQIMFYVPLVISLILNHLPK